MSEGFVASFVKMALGPHGRFLSSLYQEHQLLINGVLIGTILIIKSKEYLLDK